MDRLELGMCESGLYQQRERVLFGMKKRLQICQAVHDVLRRWGHVGSVSRPRSANPILALAKLSRLGMTPSSLGQQDLVDLANKAERERKATA